MKFIDEYRNPAAVTALAQQIAQQTTRSWTIMEICGGQTHAIVRFGVDGLLPPEITLVHGPGCPVCVTPMEMIDKAIEIAGRDEVSFCSFGDMMRVPGSSLDLLSAKADGADVRMIYSPLDAVRTAADHPERQVVLFAVGFETTAPATAMAAYQARKQKLKNFSLLVSHVLVPPAMDAILSVPDCHVQGFLAAGHVCTVMGYADYEPLADQHGVPIVVTGFEPLDLLRGLATCIQQLETGRNQVENQYERVVRRDGNPSAKQLIAQVFTVTDRKWRGIGTIPHSGWKLSPAYAELDAENRFGTIQYDAVESTECISGEILRGVRKPPDCPAFGTRCTPERPLGATMVSSEGACAAYHRYRRTSIANRGSDTPGAPSQDCTSRPPESASTVDGAPS